MIGIRILVTVLMITTLDYLNSLATVPDECLVCGCCVNSTCIDERSACMYGCVDGYYGSKCYNKCPEYCKRCAQQFGSAIIQGDYNICYECADGYYNGTFVTNCSSPCPRNCLDGICDKNNGICSLGCTGNFKGRTCRQCKDGWHQNDCSKKCSDNCKLGKCVKTSGKCEGGCTQGYHGAYCNLSCSEGCLDKTCFKYTSTCNKGCKPGYSGDVCCMQSDNCVKCASASECSVCKVGYWGQLCDNKCDDACLDYYCNMSDGSCNACNDGFHGDLCNGTCSDTCLDSVCQQSDGSCYNCTDGYFGTLCENTCSVTCKNISCSQHGGECLYGCVQGYNGTLCDVLTYESANVDTVWVVGTSIGVVITVALLVVFGIVCYKKRLSSASELKDTNVLYQKSDSSYDNEQDECHAHTDTLTNASESSQHYQNVCYESDKTQTGANLYEQLDPTTMDK